MPITRVEWGKGMGKGGASFGGVIGRLAKFIFRSWSNWKLFLEIRRLDHFLEMSILLFCITEDFKIYLWR